MEAPAMNYEFMDGGGEFGIITSIRNHAAATVTGRESPDGKVVPCLFNNNEYDLATLMRNGASGDDIAEFLIKSVKLKAPGVESLIKGKVSLKNVRPLYVNGG